MLKTGKAAMTIALACSLAVWFLIPIYAAVETSLTQVASTKYQDIKFQGTAVREELGPGVAWWIVSVDKIISGLQPCQSQLQVLVGGGVLEPGYVDPNIRPGDKIEVYGEYYVTGEGCGVFICETYHYIKKIAASTNYNLRVQVYDSVTGRMISGAAVYIDSDPTPKGVTDSNGEVTTSIPQGHHTISASNSGYEEGTWSGTIDHDMGIAIGLNPGVVRYRLRVQVYDATTRRMLSGASLFVDQEASPRGLTDASGEATISVSQDVHTIRASKPGYAEGVWNGQIDKDMGIAISLDPAEQRWNTVIRGRIVGEPNYSSSNFDVLIGEVIDDPAHGDNVIVGNTITVYTDSEQLYQLQKGDNVEISAAWDTHLYCLPSKYSSDYIKKISGPVENHSPVPDFTWRPQEPGVGEIVHFTDTSYDPDNVVGHRAFAWNDGSSPNVIYDQKNPTHVFTKAGTYDVGLALWDESWDKTWQMTKPVTVLPEEEELSLTLFEPEIDGYTVTLNGVQKGAPGPPKWNWGDGTPEEYHWFANTHTCAKAGTYTISVTACNAAGKCITETKTVVIEFPGSFAGSEFSCACMSNGKIRCSLHYNNQLGEKAQILFLFTKGEAGKVVRHELVEVGQGSGTAEVYFDCPGSEPGRYCISWRAYRKSDGYLENPITWSKSYEEQEVDCPCGGEEGKPNPPTNLQAIVISSSQMQLIWSDNSDNEERFEIERKHDGGNYNKIESSSSDESTYSDTGLEKDTEYCYRVRACNSAGCSDYSNEDCAATQSEIECPDGGIVYKEHYGIAGTDIPCPGIDKTSNTVRIRAVSWADMPLGFSGGSVSANLFAEVRVAHSGIYKITFPFKVKGVAGITVSGGSGIIPGIAFAKAEASLEAYILDLTTDEAPVVLARHNSIYKKDLISFFGGYRKEFDEVISLTGTVTLTKDHTYRMDGWISMRVVGGASIAASSKAAVFFDEGLLMMGETGELIDGYVKLLPIAIEKLDEEEEIDAQITDLNIDYAEYELGDKVYADVTVKNTGNVKHNFYIGYSVQDENGDWWDAPYKNLYLSSGDTGTIRLVWTVESDAPEGSHLARVTVWERESGGKLYGELDRREKPNAFTVKIPSDATPPSIPRLILPANGATLPNEPIKWTFNWSDSDDGNGSGVKGYQIYVIGPNARIPVVDTFVKESCYNHTSAGFIAGQNLDGWTWKVKAQDNAGNWSDWSEVQTFNVAGLGGSSSPG